jgi:formylglycine-generating enzyme required for sulfatase activity
VVTADSKNLAEMVRVPPGAFVMGSNDGPDDERPRHKVEIEDFSTDRTPVTNAQFAAFLNNAGVKGPNGEHWYDVDDNGRTHSSAERQVGAR